jgi:hypothetical protein
MATASDQMELISQTLLEPSLLFWKQHSQSELEKLMIACNLRGPQCQCLSCAVSGRKAEAHKSMPWGTHCTFKAWFDKQLAKHGLTTATGVQKGQKPVQVPHRPACAVYEDMDAHFHHLTRDDWVLWTYCAWLWKEPLCATDQDLQKLAAFFQSLSDATNDQ